MQELKYFSDDNPYNQPPDIFELFQFYNSYFFDNLLVACTLKWSQRMTLCAGTCKYEGQKSCTITLSEPLLKFRTNDELKSTLLHEMIHAYLFITKPNEAFINEGHGPAFLELMYKINQITGLQLSVYHQFHDEVERCRNHIWRCNGKCQQKPPFFGYVKRSINRPPGKTDYWFAQHQQECGGIFEKISEPEKKQKEKEKKIKINKKKPEKHQQQIDNKQITISSFFINEQMEVSFLIENKEIMIEFILSINSQYNFEMLELQLIKIINCLNLMCKQNFENFNIKKHINLKSSLEKTNNVKILQNFKEKNEKLIMTYITIHTNENFDFKESILLKLNELL